MTDVEEITCPECDRRWPIISEQAIVTDLYGKCYACLIGQVVILRDELVAKADYVIQQCSVCGGLEPAREKCTSCFSRGWESVDKEPSLIQLVH